jgi:hypothetical protein
MKKTFAVESTLNPQHAKQETINLRKTWLFHPVNYFYNNC